MEGNVWSHSCLARLQLILFSEGKVQRRILLPIDTRVLCSPSLRKTNLNYNINYPLFNKRCKWLDAIGSVRRKIAINIVDTRRKCVSFCLYQVTIMAPYLHIPGVLCDFSLSLLSSPSTLFLSIISSPLCFSAFSHRSLVSFIPYNNPTSLCYFSLPH